MSDEEFAQRDRRAARRWTWIGIGFAIGAVVILLAFAFLSREQTSGDPLGEDDAGVVHPDPIGVDDDVTGGR